MSIFALKLFWRSADSVTKELFSRRSWRSASVQVVSSRVLLSRNAKKQRLYMKDNKPICLKLGFCEASSPSSKEFHGFKELVRENVRQRKTVRAWISLIAQVINCNPNKISKTKTVSFLTCLTVGPIKVFISFYLNSSMVMGEICLERGLTLWTCSISVLKMPFFSWTCKRAKCLSIVKSKQLLFKLLFTLASCCSW